MAISSSRRLAPLFALAALTLATHAVAAPVQGPPDMAFYDPMPLPAGGGAGDLLSYRNATVNLGAGAPSHRAWNVMYRSTDSVGAPTVVTGTALVPTAAWTGVGARPIVSYAVGTHGLNQRCAPSLQMAAGSDYEAANIAAALKAGYTVVVTDYQGYTNGKTPTYLAGKSQGHAVLDIVKASAQIPSAGISSSAKVAIWGYSQGGQSAAFAGEQHALYASSLNLVGVAAGGVPGDFKRTARNLDGNAGAAFLLGGVIGLAEQYPDNIPLDTLANQTGKQAIATGKSQCVFESLLTFMNHRLSEYTVNNQTLEQLMAVPSISEALVAQDLGGQKINVPLYQYHGQADEFIPLDQAVALKKKYCGRFSNVAFELFPSEHIATQFQAAPQVVSWLSDRFAGKAATGTCNTTAPEPQSTANPGGGNFVVTLKDWLLKASVGLKTLGQTVEMPKESTLAADADITGQRLSGTLNIPSFKKWISIIGLPIQVGLEIVPVGPISGTTSLDGNGQLHIDGEAKADIKITSVLGINWGECKTVTPVVFPLKFDGPVSALGSGQLNFTGQTSFPLIRGCFISAILSALMSGSGQTYTFTAIPPAPVKY